MDRKGSKLGGIMIEKANKIINSGFIKQNGFKVLELNEEKCVLEYTVKEDGLNPMNMVHGGLLFGLADTAAGILSSLNNKKQVTTSSNINYLNPLYKGKAYATATIIKRGNSIGYFYVEIKDESNTLIATANVNMYYK